MRYHFFSVASILIAAIFTLQNASAFEPEKHPIWPKIQKDYQAKIEKAKQDSVKKLGTPLPSDSEDCQRVSLYELKQETIYEKAMEYCANDFAGGAAAIAEGAQVIMQMANDGGESTATMFLNSKAHANSFYNQWVHFVIKNVAAKKTQGEIMLSSYQYCANIAKKNAKMITLNKKDMSSFNNASIEIEQALGSVYCGDL